MMTVTRPKRSPRRSHRQILSRAAAGGALVVLAAAGCVAVVPGAAAQTAQATPPVPIPREPDPIYTTQRRSAEAEIGPPEREMPLLRLGLGLDYPLSTGAGNQTGNAGLGSQGSQQAVSPTLRASLTVSPLSYWFVNVHFYRYLRPERQQSWNPDFTYAFGYDDWHSGSVGFQYANYGGNRVHPDRAAGESATRFREGVWELNYKFDMPAAWRPIFVARDDHQVGCQAGLRWTPRYTDLKSLSTRTDKTAATLGCRYTLPGGWFAGATAFVYSDRAKQQPWDPDFTYAFGYGDWRPGGVSIQYGNYSGNRFPGRERADGQGRLRDGSLSIFWNLAW